MSLAMPRPPASMSMERPIAKETSPGSRDLRLDLFRGLANWAIFLDHIPNNVVAWVTTRNYGFSDAADVFVFISGYTAAFIYARKIVAQGHLAGTALLIRRVWQLYVAHVLLFVFYAAAIGYVAQDYGHSHLLDEFNVAGLIEHPVATLTQGLLLKFKPLNLDVLPLYIVLMAGFAPLLMLMMRVPDAALTAAMLVYVLARYYAWNFPAHPTGGWYFNPFTWQLLFTMGAWAALGGAARAQAWARSRTVLIASVAFVVFAFVVTVGARLGVSTLSPLFDDLSEKTNLAPYRIVHFLALAVIVVHLVPRNWKGLDSKLARPVILCGQRSLEVFCIGIFLSFVGHFILEMYSDRLLTQIGVSVGGLLLMTAVALYRTWSRTLDARAPKVSVTSAAIGRKGENV